MAVRDEASWMCKVQAGEAHRPAVPLQQPDSVQRQHDIHWEGGRRAGLRLLWGAQHGPLRVRWDIHRAETVQYPTHPAEELRLRSRDGSEPLFSIRNALTGLQRHHAKLSLSNTRSGD